MLRITFIRYAQNNLERHLMKVILSIPDEGYSERHLMKVILSVPDEGYSERHLMKVIPETRRPH
jgi:hypothetical protein